MKRHVCNSRCNIRRHKDKPFSLLAMCHGTNLSVSIFDAEPSITLTLFILGCYLILAISTSTRMWHIKQPTLPDSTSCTWMARRRPALSSHSALSLRAVDAFGKGVNGRTDGGRVTRRKKRTMEFDEERVGAADGERERAEKGAAAASLPL